MLARIFAAGLSCWVLMGVVAPIPVSAAGSSAWTGYANQGRIQFRPWQARSERHVSNERWRPHHRSPSSKNPAPRYQTALRQHPALIAPESRYSAPVSRAFARSVSAGVRFRPNSRAAVAAADRVQTTPQAVMLDPSLQSQFRPSEQKRRSTYEQLQAARPSTGSWNPYTRVARYDPTLTQASRDMMSGSTASPIYWRSW